MNLTDRLADALRAINDTLRPLRMGGLYLDDDEASELTRAAREALAAYDAQQAQPPDDRPTPAGDHTAEPWQALGEFIGTCEDDHQTIAYTSDHRNRKTRPAAQREADARRIVACVNACAGTSTEKLESGRYGVMQTVFGTFTKQDRDA